MGRKKRKKIIRALDIFCGAGGSSYGASLAGVTPVAAVDMWQLATDTYKLNFPEATVYRMLASTVRPSRIKSDVGRINLLLASPECTNHSVAKGNRPRSEDSRATAFQVIRLAKALRPRWVVVENVLQMRNWHRFDEWLHKLQEAGYKTTFGVLDAQYHQTAQTRRRLFVVGDRRKKPALPKQARITKKTVATILGRGELKKGPWSFSPLRTSFRAKATLERAQRAITELGPQTPFLMVYYGTDGAGGFQPINRPLRTITTLDRFAYVRKNGHGHEMRMLQPSELAAAMGFPAGYKWPIATRREQIKLIGNAVCPLVMRDVIRTLVQ